MLLCFKETAHRPLWHNRRQDRLGMAGTTTVVAYRETYEWDGVLVICSRKSSNSTEFSNHLWHHFNNLCFFLDSWIKFALRALWFAWFSKHGIRDNTGLEWHVLQNPTGLKNYTNLDQRVFDTTTKTTEFQQEVGVDGKFPPKKSASESLMKKILKNAFMWIKRPT